MLEDATSRLLLQSAPGVTVALVEPRIPQNTGNIARLCACTGAELVLVGSLGFKLGDKYLERAGMDYMDDIPIHQVADYGELTAKCAGYMPYFISTKAQNSYLDVDFAERALLVFGSETHGLPAWLIEEHPDTSLRIPMVADARSLNLANSVAIVLYEVIRQRMAQPKGLQGQEALS